MSSNDHSSDDTDRYRYTDETPVGHCKSDTTDVYIGRGPNGCHMNNTEIGNRGWLGNPYPVGEDYTRKGSIRAFRADFEKRLKSDAGFRESVKELYGERLGCWCQQLDKESPSCHGEVIAEWATKLHHGVEIGDDDQPVQPGTGRNGGDEIDD